MNIDLQGSGSVSRSGHIGADLTIGGRAVVRHGLLVEGWLEARHTVGPMKGLFVTPDALRSRWARPEPGWWALVGDTLPAEVWVERKGRWAPTGHMASGVDVPLDYLNGVAHDLDMAMPRRLDFEAGPESGEILLRRPSGDLTAIVPAATQIEAGLMTAGDRSLLTRLAALEETISSAAGSSGLRLALSPLPAELAPGQRVLLSPTLWKGGEEITPAAVRWRVTRVSGSPQGDAEWNGAHELTPGAGLRMELTERDLADGVTQFLVEAWVAEEEAPAKAWVTLRTAQAVVSDRGPWREGVRYSCGDERGLSGRMEVSDVWRWGCRWRCTESHTSASANGPGWGSTLWRLIAGDRTPRIEADRRYDDVVISHGQTVVIPFRVMAGGEDITFAAVRWEVERTTGDAAADAVWNNDHAGFSGTLSVTVADMGGSVRCDFTVTAYVRDDTADGPAMRKVRSVLSA